MHTWKRKTRTTYRTRLYWGEDRRETGAVCGLTCWPRYCPGLWIMESCSMDLGLRFSVRASLARAQCFRPYGSQIHPHWPFPASRQLLNHLQALLRPSTKSQAIRPALSELSCTRSEEQTTLIWVGMRLFGCSGRRAWRGRDDAMGWDGDTRCLYYSEGGDRFGCSRDGRDNMALHLAVAAPFSRTCGRRRHMDTYVCTYV